MTPAMTVGAIVALPFLGAVLVVATDRHPNLRETMTLATAGTAFLLVASLIPAVAGGARPELFAVAMMPGLEIRFVVEPLGMLFAAVASFLWIVTSLYSIGYMRGHHEENQTRFYAYFAVAIGSALGVAFAGNMLTLFAFYELLTLSTFPLVTHHGTEEAKRAGRVYLGLLLGTSIAFQLFAIVWTWSAAGTLDFRPGGILAGKAPDAAIGLLLALYVFGIGKAAVMPFHRWLPAAMVAPTPVSALLHAVAVVKAGVFTILKVVVYIFGIDLLAGIEATRWLAYVAGATVVIASLVALYQDNLKARLAYSTVSQLSYVVLGALLATGAGAAGAALHIVTHAFGKITLFFCAGAILVASHKTEVSEMAGLGRAMPVTFAAFFVASLSLIGLPPLGGVWSKWYLSLAAADAGQLVLLGVLMISSLLNVAYLLPVAVRGYLPGKGVVAESAGAAAVADHGVPSGIQEAPVSCLIALSLTAAGCVALFFFADRILDFLKPAVGM